MHDLCRSQGALRYRALSAVCQDKTVRSVASMLQADEARRQAELEEQQSAEQRFLELQQKAEEEQAR